MGKIPDYVRDIFAGNPTIGRKALAEKAHISIQEARFYCKLFKQGNSKPTRKGIAVGDIHYPEDNPKCKKIMFDFIEDFEPDIFIAAGDQLDMATISVYNRKKPKLLENKRLRYDYDGFQKAYLDKWDKILKPDCKRYWMYGNHEYRVDRLIEARPQHEGFIEVNKNLDLSKWKEIPYNDCLSLGEMNFIHGHYHNKYHTAKNVGIYGKQIFNWHVHTNQIYTMSSPINRLPKQGVSVGCMCDKNPEYLKSKPNRWIHQFMYFYLYGDGSFTYYTPIIINGKVTINGKLYKA